MNTTLTDDDFASFGFGTLTVLDVKDIGALPEMGAMPTDYCCSSSSSSSCC